MYYLKLTAILVPVLLGLDLFWIGVLMKKYYTRELWPLARKSGESLSVQPLGAAVVYVLLIAGMLCFVLPKVEGRSVWEALAWGALYGATLYGLHDFTNFATLDPWSLQMSAIDTVWGGVLCGVGAVVLKFAARWLA